MLYRITLKVIKEGLTFGRVDDYYTQTDSRHELDLSLEFFSSCGFEVVSVEEIHDKESCSDG